MATTLVRQITCDGCGLAAHQEIQHEKHEPGLPEGWFKLTLTNWLPGVPRGDRPPDGVLVDVHSVECARKAITNLLTEALESAPDDVPQGHVRHHD